MNRITKLIKDTIKEFTPTEFRYVSAFGNVLVDPYFILCGLQPSRGVDFEYEYDFDGKMSINEVYQNLLNYYFDALGTPKDLQLILVKGNMKTKFVPLLDINFAEWLERQDFHVAKDKIIVVPQDMIRHDGKGYFKKGDWEARKGIPSPYFIFFSNLIENGLITGDESSGDTRAHFLKIGSLNLHASG